MGVSGQDVIGDGMLFCSFDDGLELGRVGGWGMKLSVEPVIRISAQAS